VQARSSYVIYEIVLSRAMLSSCGFNLTLTASLSISSSPCARYFILITTPGVTSLFTYVRNGNDDDVRMQHGETTVSMLE